MKVISLCSWFLNLDSFVLPNGVMVALQILVLSVWVRVLVWQQKIKILIWESFFFSAELMDENPQWGPLFARAREHYLYARVDRDISWSCYFFMFKNIFFCKNICIYDFFVVSLQMFSVFKIKTSISRTRKQ